LILQFRLRNTPISRMSVLEKIFLILLFKIDVRLATGIIYK